MTGVSPRPTLPAVLIAIGAAFTVSLVIIVALSDDPSRAVFFFFAGPLIDSYHFGNMLDTAGLLALTGLGVAVAFRGGTFNLGGEGQSYLGSLVAAQIALTLFPADLASPLLVVPLVLLVSSAAGGVTAAVSGALRALWNIDELITSFLISSAALPIIDYLIGGPLRDPEGYLLATARIPTAARIPHLFAPSALNAGALVSIATVVIVWFSLQRTLPGYELRLTGVNPRFARYGGISTGAYFVGAMAASGLLHGLAGGLYVVGTRYMAVQRGTAGLGWNGIAVALIAENRPLAVIPAALVFSYLETATDTAILNTGFSFELSAIVQAAVFLLITAKAFGRS